MQQHLRMLRHVNFGDLGFSREPVTDNISCAQSALEEFCVSDGVESDVVLSNQEVAGWMIAQWYRLHREFGGAPDPAAEALLQEQPISRRGRLN